MIRYVWNWERDESAHLHTCTLAHVENLFILNKIFEEEYLNLKNKGKREQLNCLQKFQKIFYV